ncbi:efflux RND transporter permease subunit [Nitrosospira sp. Nsp1]|uniref:efflux RND transporter permease subunit n=1 Tax=Nitrosospira sp. Nsp1 TaxID=136547 RepID=UPI00089098B3|nr:efflux RND transporter permease subunit [Nitrosospira sp. Nsp1]SCX56397.1 Multidrug efflux pump subunit AcrB [Nitrosospira sp. Nsp1]
MNQIVLIALRRPYTFVVLSILIVIFGVRAIRHSPTDVFPTIKIPVISVVWAYAGMLPLDVSGRITFYFERFLTSTVEGISDIVSQAYYGISITNIFLQPHTNLPGAEAEVTAIAQTIVKALPPDISPPMIMRLEASQVAVASLQITSDEMTPADLYNLAYNQLRPLIVVIPGAIVPHPYGGKPKQLLVSLDQDKMLARNISPTDIHAAFDRQNIVLPAGDMKIKQTDWMVQTNAMPPEIPEFNDIPIKREGNSFVFLRDVADVQLAGPPQTNSVIVDGKQAVIIVVMKSGEASTLDVVDGIRATLPRIKEIVPSHVDVRIITDASVFVRESINEVTHEMAIAGLLVGLIVMLMLGSWRPMIVVTTSIPLCILTSLIFLQVLGESMNVMTLGGLALAVGILVDDATVMIENIDTHLEMGKELDEAIIDAANQIVIPTLLATLCICIVWLPLFTLSGVSGYLFKPMALAVIFAMLASFILSRTLVPTMAKYLIKHPHAEGHGEGHAEEHAEGHGKEGDHPGEEKPGGKAAGFKEKLKYHMGIFSRFQQAFEARFLQFCAWYGGLLEQTIANRRRFVTIMLAFALVSLVLFYFNGRDFFPEVRSGTIQMHMRAPLGTRIEAVNRITTRVAEDISRMLPGQVEGVISNCGLPVGPHNLAFIPTPTIGTQDCDLTITLFDEKSAVWDLRKIIHKGLKERYPGTEFTFQPADLIAKILNFGAPSPITVQVNGMDIYANYEYARKLQGKLRKIPGSSDVVIQQTMRTPTLFVEGQRTYGLGVDRSESDIALNMLITTNGTQQIDQKYWLDLTTGMSYQINIYQPQPWVSSTNELNKIPVKPEGEGGLDEKYQLLGNLTQKTPVGTPGLVTHRGIMPLIEVYVSAEGRGLGDLLDDVKKIVEEMDEEVPRGSDVQIAGQAANMVTTYGELLIGLAAAVVLIYLLLVVNFQSWLVPFIIITALPGALAGIAWALFLTQTNISVPALTGAIMAMGTATANSILVVAYALERIEVHGDALRAAVESGKARIRPVLMTAAAMIMGMLPMAMGGSTNAPLGRAVIGGLMFATIYTLFFVPAVYAIMYYARSVPKDQESISQQVAPQLGNS